MRILLALLLATPLFANASEYTCSPSGGAEFSFSIPYKNTMNFGVGDGASGAFMNTPCEGSPTCAFVDAYNPAKKYVVSYADYAAQIKYQKCLSDYRRANVWNPEAKELIPECGYSKLPARLAMSILVSDEVSSTFTCFKNRRN